jgi:hypothetical protein
MAKYRLKAPVSAVLHKPGGVKESVMLSVGTVLDYQPGNLLAQFFSISNAKSTQVKIMVATVK